MGKRDQFTVLQGGRSRSIRLNGISITVVPDSLSPLPVDVRVFEEDTFLVLTVDPVQRYTEEHPIRLMTEVMEIRPRLPGTVVVNGASWYAVVHDLDAEPSLQKEWIARAYSEAFLLAEQKRVRRIGIPLLGSVHGFMEPEESLFLLLRSCRSVTFRFLEKLFLLVAPKSVPTVMLSLLRAATPV